MTSNHNSGGPGYRDGADETPVPFSDYLRVLARRKTLLVIGLIVGLALGATFAKVQGKSYQSTAQVQVGALPNITGNNVTSSQPNMDTETTLAQSQAVAERALSQIKSAHKTLTTSMILSDLTVSYPAKSTILTFQCTTSNAADAQVICQTLTDAYLSIRHDTAVSEVNTQIKALEGKIAPLQADLTKQEQLQATALKGSTDAATAQQNVNRLNGQITPLQNKLSTLQTVNVDAGSIAVPASIGQTTGLNSKLIVGIGGLVGLVLFILIAFLVDRADDRLRSEDDIERLGLPVVADLPRPTSADQKALNDPSTWPTSKRRAYGKLAARVLVASRRHEISVITMMGVGDEPTDRLVAANFAVALAQAGRRVNLVLTGAGGAPVPAAVPAATGLPAVPAPSPELLPSPVSGLHFTELAAVNGSVNMDAADFLSGDLRRGADFVVVAAPPITSAADSLVLASVSDATILIANERSSHRGELGEAADSLVQIGAPLFGVVLARRGGHRQSRRRRAADRRAAGSLSILDAPDLETIRQS